MTINVLGEQYEYVESDLNNPELAEADGICQTFDKVSILRKEEYLAGFSPKAKQQRREDVIRHELVHAFAQESGVQYGENEDLVDWVARMIPKINKVFQSIMEEYPHECASADCKTTESPDNQREDIPD